MKICIVSSHGGHLAELLQLMEAFGKYNIHLIVHKDNVTIGIKNDVIRTKYLIPVFFNLRLLVIDMIIISIYELLIFIREKPNVIISTGSEIAIPIFILAKITGTETIFIESLARMHDISITGKILIRIADIFLVQWSELTIKYKKARYVGKIL